MAEVDGELGIDTREEREKHEETRGLGRSSEYDKGRTLEAILARSSNPEAIRSALRDRMLMNETFVSNGETPKGWNVSHMQDVLQDREEVYGRPLDHLVRLGLVSPLDESTRGLVVQEIGKSIPGGLREQYFGTSEEVGGHSFVDFSVGTMIPDSYVQGADGKYVPKTFRRQLFPVSYFGTPEERKVMSKELGSVRNELLARNLSMDIMGYHYTFYYALQKLTEGSYFNNTLTSEGLGILFNLKSQEGAKKESITGVKMESLGEKVETAMRLYYVAALSEKPDRFKKELMGSPGWEEFLFPNGTNPEIVKEWIGTPEAWEKETQAGGNRMAEDKKRGIEDTTNKERKAGLRGKLTRKNIFAYVDTYAEGQLHSAIEEFLGGGEGVSFVDGQEAKTAQMIGYRMFRMFLLPDQEGFELLRETQSNNDMDPYDGLKIEFANAPSASDYGKLAHPDLYAGKSMRKNRDYMPDVGYKFARKHYSSLIVDFLRHIAAPTEISVTEGGASKRIVENRSLMERWWGYKGGFNKNGVTYGEEKPVRLGDLPWSEFNEDLSISKEEASMLEIPVGAYHHEAFKSLLLSGFMAGGTDKIHMTISSMDHNPQNLMNDQWWEKFWKSLDVGVKPGTVLEGKFRGMSGKEIKEAVLKHKLGFVKGFVLGLQGLPSWGEWREKEVTYLPRGKGNEKSRSVTSLILTAANRGLGRSGVSLKQAGFKDLLEGKIEKET